MKKLLPTILRIHTLALLLVIIFQGEAVFGQESKSEIELKKFLTELRTSKVDTFLIVKSGCIGCELKYNDTSETISDGQSIYVMTQHQGKFNVAVFDDLHKQKYFAIDTCSIFRFISLNKSTLLQKEEFYKKEIPKIKSKDGFFPPSPIHYSYEKLIFNLSNFKYEFEIVYEDKDHFGLKRDKENWFILTKEIIRKVYTYL